MATKLFKLVIDAETTTDVEVNPYQTTSMSWRKMIG